MTISTVIVGTIIHSLSQTHLEILQPGIIALDASKQISLVQRTSSTDISTIQQDLSSKGLSTTPSTEFIFLTKTQFIIPGFIDTHIHAPQYVFTGTGLDLPLLEWLNKYTFPREAAFKDTQYADNAYSKVVKRTLLAGTTTACYYGTIHNAACDVLVGHLHRIGQRAFVGKVNMDRHSPDWYVETTEDSIKDTEVFVKKTLEVNKVNGNDLVTPVITPRFAPTCTETLMKALADIATRYKLPIQTHISENTAECAWVQDLFSDSGATDYTDVYDKMGLLTPQTILAHAIYLSEDEKRRIKQRNAGISHCPTSNFCLQSGVLNVRQLLDAGIKVGLGTDVSGGYSPSMLTAVRDAMTASKVTTIQSKNTSDTDTKPTPALTLPEVLWLATMGGAQVLNLDSKIGNFVNRKELDALVIDVSTGDNIDLFDHDDVLTTLEKWVYLGDDRNIVKIFVAGKVVHGC